MRCRFLRRLKLMTFVISFATAVTFCLLFSLFPCHQVRVGDNDVLVCRSFDVAFDRPHPLTTDVIGVKQNANVIESRPAGNNLGYEEKINVIKTSAVASSSAGPIAVDLARELNQIDHAAKNGGQKTAVYLAESVEKRRMERKSTFRKNCTIRTGERRNGPGSVNSREKVGRDEKLENSDRRNSGIHPELKTDSRESMVVDIETLSRQGTEDGNNNIPRILHRMWKTNNIPEEWSSSVTSCTESNPDYGYCLWTDTELDTFIETEYPWFLLVYRAYPYHIERVDSARYFILHHYGGVYLDLDLACRYPFGEILRIAGDESYAEVQAREGPGEDWEGERWEGSDGEAGEEGEKEAVEREGVGVVDVILAETDPTGVTNSFIATRPGNVFMKRLIYGLENASGWYVIPYASVMYSTGPMYVTRAYWQHLKLPPQEQQRTRVAVVPINFYKRIYFLHLNGSTWHRWDAKIVKWLGRWYRTLILIGVVVFIISLLIFLSFLIGFYRRGRKGVGVVNFPEGTSGCGCCAGCASCCGWGLERPRAVSADFPLSSASGERVVEKCDKNNNYFIPLKVLRVWNAPWFRLPLNAPWFRLPWLSTTAPVVNR